MLADISSEPRLVEGLERELQELREAVQMKSLGDGVDEAGDVLICSWYWVLFQADQTQGGASRLPAPAWGSSKRNPNGC